MLEHLQAVRGQLQAAVVLHIDREQPRGDELAKDGGPLPLREFLTVAEGRKALMAELAHLLGLGAAEHIYEMPDAEELLRLVDHIQRLAGDQRAVPGLDRRQAGIAVAAGLRQLITKIL